MLASMHERSRRLFPVRHHDAGKIISPEAGIRGLDFVVMLVSDSSGKR
jgi:hypothetical protein